MHTIDHRNYTLRSFSFSANLTKDHLRNDLRHAKTDKFWQYHKYVRQGSLVIAILFLGLWYGSPTSVYAQGTIQSDDFNACTLSAHWNTVLGQTEDPEPTLNNGQLTFSVPENIRHDIWTDQISVSRLMQAVSDDDFEVEIKYDSLMTDEFQTRGILVEQANGNVLRFELLHNGSETILFAAFISSTSVDVKHYQTLGSISPAYMRVKQAGNTWTHSYSVDGDNWVTASFQQTFTMSAIGPYVGNAAYIPGNEPEHTAIIDYFYNTAVPGLGDDIGPYTITTTTTGNGAVTTEPDRVGYPCGETVTISANPAAGWEFVSWSGALSGNTNPAALTIDENITVTALFQQSQPLTYTVDINTVGNGTAVVDPAQSSYLTGTLVSLTANPASGWEFIGWSGDLSGNTNPASLLIDANKTITATFQESQLITFTLGTDTVGSGTIVANPAQSAYLTGTQVLLAATPITGWEFVGWSGDLTGTANPASITMNADKVVTATFQQSQTSTIFSDDFNRCTLGNNGWSFVHPGDATLTLDGTRAVITLPANADHDIWVTSGNALAVNAARLMQPAPDIDFTTEVKFESSITERYQTQGTLIGGANNDLLRIEFLGDGYSTNIFIAYIVEGSYPAVITYQQVGSQSLIPQFMRVQRQGNQWTVDYSFDGSLWNTAKTFTRAMEVTEVGVYGGNAADFPGNEPAHTTIIDYFFNSAAPIAPEDGSGYALAIDQQGNGTVVADPNLVSYACDETVTLTATPDPGWEFVSWSGDLAGSTNPASLTMDGNKSVTAIFQQNPNTTFTLDVQAQGNGTIVIEPEQSSYLIDTPVTLTATPNAGWEFVGWSGALSGSTNPVVLIMDDNKVVTALFVDPTAGPAIDIWYGDTQSFGTLGNAQRWVNVLGNVTSNNTISSLSYTLNGGTSRGLFTGADDRRLAAPGDFNIEIDRAELNEGTNIIEITAVDDLQLTSVKTATLSYNGTNTWPLPYDVQWDTVTDLQNATQIVDGYWQKVSGGVRTIDIDYDRVLAFGDIAWTDYEVTVPLTLNGLDRAGANNGTSIAPGYGLTPRWAGHTDNPIAGWDPHVGWLPAGATPWADFGRGDKLHVNENPVIPAVNFAVGDTHLWKMRVESVPSGVLYSTKVWPDNQPEPGSWQYTVQTGESDVDNGSLLVIAHHVDLTVGDLSIVPVENTVSSASGEKLLPLKYQPEPNTTIYLPLIHLEP